MAGFVLASVLCLASCQKEEAFTAVTDPDPRSEVSFTLDEVGALSVQTRSLLTSSDIETKKTSVTLAAYRGGTLQASGYYTTGLSQMSLELVSGETYNIYAFVNMENQGKSNQSDGFHPFLRQKPGGGQKPAAE